MSDELKCTVLKVDLTLLNCSPSPLLGSLIIKCICHISYLCLSFLYSEPPGHALYKTSEDTLWYQQQVSGASEIIMALLIEILFIVSRSIVLLIILTLSVCMYVFMGSVFFCFFLH